jgi:hypothetical protein
MDTTEQGAPPGAGNRLTGEHRDLITSKVTLADDPTPAPGYGSILTGGMTATYPLSSEFAGEIQARLEDGMTVIRAWDVLWPADGSASRVVNDTGYLT